MDNTWSRYSIRGPYDVTYTPGIDLPYDHEWNAQEGFAHPDEVGTPLYCRTRFVPIHVHSCIFLTLVVCWIMQTPHSPGGVATSQLYKESSSQEVEKFHVN
jgi:hypothetical protein